MFSKTADKLNPLPILFRTYHELIFHFERLSTPSLHISILHEKEKVVVHISFLGLLYQEYSDFLYLWQRTWPVRIIRLEVCNVEYKWMIHALSYALPIHWEKISIHSICGWQLLLCSYVHEFMQFVSQIFLKYKQNSRSFSRGATYSRFAKCDRNVNHF